MKSRGHDNTKYKFNMILNQVIEITFVYKRNVIK
jgi:hypothetical protein